MEKVIYTLGHSNRSLNDFLHILMRYQIANLVDIRRFPTSRKYPYFNKDYLSSVLFKHGFKYYWLGNELGGYREGGYLKFMEKPEFKQGIRKLLRISLSNPTAIMCSEKFWFRCHRRFISDLLVKMGYRVIHIIDIDKTYEHKYRGYVNGLSYSTVE